MKSVKQLILGLALAMTVTSSVAHASSYTVWNAQIQFVAADNGIGANMIQSYVPTYLGSPHPWCGNRAYIAAADKSLYSVALAAALSGKSVSFIYDDNHAPATFPGHVAGLVCRVISMWVN
jgi:hypothetical protein